MRKHIFISLFSGLLLLAGSPSYAEDYRIAPHKEETAQRIFDRLIEARGGHPKPILQFVPGDAELAKILGQTIYLGERAYDVCTSFGKDSLNALAFLLSHELIHFYESHTWEEEFSRNFASNLTDIVQDHWIEDEVQADLWGGMLAYSAGYQVYDVVASLFPRLYATYGEDEEIPGYPRLSERIAMAEQTAVKLATLTDLFETANYLVALGMYEDAAAYYELMLLEGYRGREVYNNLGVYHTLAAIDLFRKSEMPYALPLELDAEARIEHSTRGNEHLDERISRIHELLNEAAAFFEEAEKLDDEYATAIINLGVVYALRGAIEKPVDPDLAEEQFLQALLLSKKAGRKAKKEQKDNLLANVYVLQGVLSALQNETEEARSTWEKAQSMDNPLASANLQILEEGAFTRPVSRLARSNSPEKIEELSLDLFIRRRPLDTLFGFQVKEMKGQWGKGMQRPGLSQSHIYYHAVSAAQYAILHVTDAGYEGSTNMGIRIGSSLEEVRQAYEDPDRMIALRGGTFLIYEANSILFELDADGKVVSWCVFRNKNLADR